MGDMKLLLKQLQERDIELCTLIDRLLTSFGYSPENKLQPDKFESFVQKAKQEKCTIYSSIEEIVNDYMGQLPNIPKPTIAYKTLEISAGIFCWPRDIAMYLPRRITRTNKNIIDAYVVATVIGIGSVLVAAYVDLKLNTYPKIMFGYALYTVLTYIVDKIKGRVNPLRKYYSEPEMQVLSQKANERQLSIDLKVHPDYNLKKFVFAYFLKEILKEKA